MKNPYDLSDSKQRALIDAYGIFFWIEHKDAWVGKLAIERVLGYKVMQMVEKQPNPPLDNLWELTEEAQEIIRRTTT